MGEQHELERLSDTNGEQFNVVFCDELKLIHRRRENTGAGRAAREALFQQVKAAFDDPTKAAGTAPTTTPGADPARRAERLGPPPDLGRPTWLDGGDVGAPVRPVGAATALNGDGAVEAGAAPRTKPHPYHLVGLALSGGGIRSASMCIGALQALDRHGALRHVDYVSTVSGGGYAGCSLAANCHGYLTQQRAAGSEIQGAGWFFPFDHRPGVRENLLFQHLRAHANFLAPRGGSDFLYVPVMLVRGVFMNLMVLAPLLITCAVAFAFAVNWQPFATRAAALDTFVGIVTGLGIVAAVLLAFSRLLRFFLEWLSLRLAKGDGVHQGEAGEVVSGLIRKGAKWPARDRVRRLFAWMSIAAVMAVVVVSQPWFVWLINDGVLDVPWSWLGGLSGVATLAPFVARFIKLPPNIRHLATVGIAVVIGPLLLWLSVLIMAAVLDRTTPVALPWVDWVVDVRWLALGAAVILYLLNRAWLYDANEVSLHTVYRDKLSKAFLFAPRFAQPRPDPEAPPAGKHAVNLAQDAPHGVMHLDSLKLSEMEVANAPYPLINAALNVQDDPDNDTRGRAAAVFTFSKAWIGSELTGYCCTSALELTNRRFTMASAMAISGAAASPISGRKTMKPVRFLLALMNVRLGYWLANPAWIAARRIRPDTAWRPWRVSPAGYLHELVGNIGAGDRVVHLSDGGHIENLGIYSLLRRRCRLIIAIDAEEDAAMSFGALGDLIRFARMDMAIQIDIDLDQVRRAGKPAEDGLSGKHMAIGEIDYGDASDKGLFVYLKSSLTGDEGEALRKYKAIEPAFPHHPTMGDQFYDEEQFEAYRSLGYHIADKAFAGSVAV